MLQTIEAKYDHGKFILLEKFPRIDTASLLITIIDDTKMTPKTVATNKTATFLGAMHSAAGLWKSKKMDVNSYVEEIRKDREL